MELSDDLYTEIRKTLGLSGTDSGEPPIAAEGKGRSRVNRRVSRADASRARAQIELPGTLIPPRYVRLIDFGQRGVSFFDNRTWAAGQKLVMHLPRSAEHMIPLLCVVRNVRAVEEWLRIGVEFVNHHEAARMAVAREDVKSEPTVEVDPIRRTPRTRFNKAAAPAQIHTYEMETAGPILEADVVDLSDGGVGLICSVQLPPGRKLMVRLCPPDGKPMTRYCEVVSCRRNDAGGYRIGTRFVEYKKERSLPQMLVGLFRKGG
jgi:PilZ domain